MATTAAVYDEKSQKAIFVGMNGYPSVMVDELQRLVKDGLRDQLFEASDYLVLGPDFNGDVTEIGAPVQGLGVRYREQGERLTVQHDSYTHAPMFYDGDKIASPDYKYTIDKAGAIVTHHKY